MLSLRNGKLSMGPGFRRDDVLAAVVQSSDAVTLEHPLHKIPISILVVIHTSDLEVLLIERADRANFWQSVTGSIDAPDEPLLEAATRELFEETGIVADGEGIVLRDWCLSNIYEIYPTWRHRYAPGVTQNSEHVFSVCVPRDIPILLSPREHVAHAWLPLLEAADRCFSSSNAEAILQLPHHLQ